MSQIKNNQFLEEAIEQIPRLLGQLNRNPSSSSYGSFDRAYWHYRTNDISCARYQEAVYTLALLYNCDFEGNNFYLDEKIFELIKAVLRFTARLQRANGSFDEWYPNEGSYVATAFLSVALGQTILLFEENHISLPERQLIADLLGKAAKFLMASKEKTVMNQVSGAILAISLAGEICHKSEFLNFATKLLTDFLSQQKAEGWWSEYGGPDIGYLSLTINYLEKCRKFLTSHQVDPAISSASTFVKAFINPDQTAGGEYMSRNTEYLIPSTSLPYLGAVRPANLDDRYLCYILYNWIEVGLQLIPQLIEISLGENYFSDSSLLRVVNNNYFLVVNGQKGGSFRLYAQDGVYYDSGLEIQFSPKNLSTGILDNTNKISFHSGELEVRGLAKVIKEPLMKTPVAIIFKTWQFIFGRVSFLQKIIKDFLRPMMINYSGHSTVTFKRVFRYNQEMVTILDIVCGAKKNNITSGVKASYGAVPSSKYATKSELTISRLLPEQGEQEEDGTYSVKRTFHFS